MRYHETKEQSAEILRRALSLMGRQDAAFHPISFALWYEHAAGINHALSVVLEERLASNTPLTEPDVLDLYSRFIVPRDTHLAPSCAYESLTS
jgi:diguanylate cyclase